MNNLQIERICNGNRRIREHFLGCYPADRIPSKAEIRQYPASFIMNTEKASEQGEHWTAVYAGGPEREVCYFDSFAMGLEQKEGGKLKQLLDTFPKIRKSSRPFQSPFSKVCAHYCIAFLYHLSGGDSFDTFISKLNTCGNSDLYVYKLVNKMII